jgi:MFS family permease
MAGWMPILLLLAVYMREYLGASVIAAMTSILIIQSLASIVSLFAGSVATRWGGRRTFLIGVVGMTLFAGLLSRIDAGWQVIALSPLAGLAIPFYWTGISTYVLQAVTPRQRGAGTGVSAFVMSMAPGVSAPILTGLGQNYGIGLTILGGAVLLALAVVVTLRLLPELAGPGRAAPTRPRFEPTRYLSLLRGRHNLAAAFTRLVAGFSHGAFQLLSALILLDVTGELSSVGFYLTAGAIGGGAAQILIGALSDRIGRRNLLIAAKAVSAGAALLFWRTDLLPLLLLASTMQSFSQSAFQTLITAINGDLAEPEEIPAVSGLHSGVYSMGMFGGALLGGLLWQLDNRIPFLIVGSLVIPSAVSAMALPRRTIAV